MNIEAKINADFTAAFKAKDFDRKNILAVVRGEMQNLKKILIIDELDDENSTIILTKFVKGIRMNIKQSAIPKSSDLYELEVLEGYLPKEISEDDIRDQIKELIESGVTNIGQVMRAFANKPVNRQLVSEIYTQLDK